jgi:iron complex transport system ATP-binding protein
MDYFEEQKNGGRFLMDKSFPEIVVNNLNVGYRSKQAEKTLIEGFSTQLKAGEIIAVMGSNGSGKSTLLRTLTGFQQPLSGGVTMNGKAISAISMKERAGLISYVSTEPVRVGNMTVFELVGLGRYLYSGWWGNLTVEDVQMVSRCLDLTGMGDFAPRQVNSLSDGERQRAMIARALAQDTPVIILDEPTAFLDVRNKYEIIHLLRELAMMERKSVIFSSHDFAITIGMADKVWLIEQRKVIDGAPEDLALSGSYNTMFKDSALTFLPESGEIIMNGKPGKKVNVVAEGNLREWLVKALFRRGFSDDIASSIKVIACIRDIGFLLTIDAGGETTEFTSIYELLVGLEKVITTAAKPV